MLIIHTDGRFEEVPYKNYRSITAGVNRTGEDHPFCAAPVPEGDAAGYCVYVNDDGLMIDMDENEPVEQLCNYAPLVGPAVVVSFEESGEEDLIGYIKPGARKKFLARLELLRKAHAF
jgi:hypothetical protein